MKTTYRAFAALAAAALFATACGSAPEEEAAGEAAGTDYQACQVTDTGGVDDRSFNQTAFKGLEDAKEQLGVETSVLESQSEADFEPNITQLLSQDCDLIVTVGFLLGEATQAAAEANPDQKFAIVDVDFFDFDAGVDITLDNVRELTFATDQAAFLAGYVAAAQSETGTVGTYGGLQIQPVTIFMDGFLAGVRYHNQEKGTAVEVIGWDGESGLFTGDFQNQDKGRQTTDQLLDAGADIIMPVAGPVGLGSAAAIEEAGRGLLVWVDTDGFVSAPNFKSLMLTSVQKNMDVAVFDTIKADLDGSFPGGLYTGTLENDGVGLAPFHEFEDAVSQETKDELDTIRAGVIDGSISVLPGDYA